MVFKSRAYSQEPDPFPTVAGPIYFPHPVRADGRNDRRGQACHPQLKPENFNDFTALTGASSGKTGDVVEPDGWEGRISRTGNGVVCNVRI